MVDKRAIEAIQGGEDFTPLGGRSNDGGKRVIETNGHKNGKNGRSNGAESVSSFVSEARNPQKTEPVAIIGIGCRFPGGANGPEAFWKLLRDGVDAISEIPESRFDIDAWYDPRPGVPGKITTRLGGFLDQVDQ